MHHLKIAIGTILLFLALGTYIDWAVSLALLAFALIPLIGWSWFKADSMEIRESIRKAKLYQAEQKRKKW